MNKKMKQKQYIINYCKELYRKFQKEGKPKPTHFMQKWADAHAPSKEELQKYKETILSK